jgi:hypothetical protein
MFILLDSSYYLNYASFLGTFAELRKATLNFMSFGLPVHLSGLFAWNNSAPTIWIFMKFGILCLLENLLKKINLY